MWHANRNLSAGEGGGGERGGQHKEVGVGRLVVVAERVP